MKTTLEEISPVKKRLRVEIDAEEVNKKLNQAYGDIRNRVRIPGFRPGKAPRKILESYYGNQIKDDVTQELIRDSFPKAVDEAKTFPLGQPVLEKAPLKQGENFVYSALMEVRPQFEVKDYLGMEIEKEILSVSDEDVQKRLEEIRKANGKLTAITEKRPIREGDYAIVDYKGFEDGQPMEGIQSPNLMVNVGKNDFHAKFDEALIGLTKDDETEVEIDFEKDFYHSRLAGKHVRFKVKIVDIKELVLPELDDAFAGSLGSDFNDLDGLRKEIRKAITSQEEKRIDGELNQKLLEKISEGLDFELPDVLVEAETDFSVNRFKDNLERGGASIEKMGLSEEGLKKEFRPVSEKRVREMLILEQIAKQDQITLDDEDLEEGYRDLAQHMGQDMETVKKYYEARGQVDSLKEELLKEKTLKYLAEHANISAVARDAIGQDKDREAGEG
ncbi:MAG: trigger factor [Deltaproteobacteria bacterium]|nr:trigger factor [Deltaproteobacteria bacterium]